MKLLIVHNSDMSSKEYKRKLVKKYPFLVDTGMYSISIMKHGGAIPSNKYTTIYFDQETINAADSVEYIDKNKDAYYLWVSLGDKKGKLSAVLPSVVVKKGKK